jgi:hypothetical protein
LRTTGAGHDGYRSWNLYRALLLKDTQLSQTWEESMAQ